MGPMTPRSDASAVSPSGFLPDGDRDVLAINGHQFDLGIGSAPGPPHPDKVKQRSAAVQQPAHGVADHAVQWLQTG